jgi:hypothetical protein
MARQDWWKVRVSEGSGHYLMHRAIHYSGIPYATVKIDSDTWGILRLSDFTTVDSITAKRISPLYVYSSYFYYITINSDKDIVLTRIDPSDWSQTELASTASGFSVLASDIDPLGWMDQSNEILYYAAAGESSAKFRKYDIGGSSDSSIGTYTPTPGYVIVALSGMWSDGTDIYFATTESTSPFESNYVFDRKIAIADGTNADGGFSTSGQGHCGFIGESGMWAETDYSDDHFNRIQNISDGKVWDFSSEGIGEKVLIVFPEGVSTYPIKALILEGSTVHGYSLGTDESITDNGSYSVVGAVGWGNYPMNFDLSLTGMGDGIRPLYTPKNTYLSSFYDTYLAFDFLKVDIS